MYLGGGGVLPSSSRGLKQQRPARLAKDASLTVPSRAEYGIGGSHVQGQVEVTGWMKTTLSHRRTGRSGKRRGTMGVTLWLNHPKFNSS